MTFQLYILRRLVFGLSFACGAMVMVAVPCVLMHAVHKLSGVGMSVVLGYVPILLLELAPFLVPIGFLLAVVSTYGRLAADNEWTAFQMTGAHPLRSMLPALLLALALSLGLGYLADEVAPGLEFKKDDYRRSSAVSILRSLSPGRTEIKVRDFYLSARERDTDNRNRFRQVFLHLPAQGDRPEQTLYAQTVDIELEGSVVWIDMTWPRSADEERDLSVGHLRLRVDLDQAMGDERVDRSKWLYQDNDELERRIEVAEARPADTPREDLEPGAVTAEKLPLAKFELHSRRAIMGLCPMFLLLGLPTGLLLRRGSQLVSLAIAIGYALAYYLLAMRMGKVLANGEVVPQWIAAWGTTVAGSLVGVLMTARAVRR